MGVLDRINSVTNKNDDTDRARINDDETFADDVKNCL